jgi:tRNA threonylcarbamoyladenosine biosynthesis protein TsaB
MLILTVRTDKPEAEIGLYLGNEQLDYQKWTAHRQLAETLHERIRALLQKQHRNWDDIEGIICYKGPGSFTGLRIGLSIANALAYARSIPIIATTGNKWIGDGIQSLKLGRSENTVVPSYGASVNTTKPRK